MSIAEALARTQIFSGLSEQELTSIAALGTQRVYQPGDTILNEGDTSRELFVIGAGTVAISIGGPEASTPIINLGAGQVFGEMTLVDRGARSATAKALDDGTTLCVIPHGAFLDVCEKDNHIGYVVMRNLAAEMSLRLRYHNIVGAMDAGR